MDNYRIAFDIEKFKTILITKIEQDYKANIHKAKIVRICDIIFIICTIVIITLFVSVTVFPNVNEIPRVVLFVLCLAGMILSIHFAEANDYVQSGNTTFKNRILYRLLPSLDRYTYVWLTQDIKTKNQYSRLLHKILTDVNYSLIDISFESSNNNYTLRLYYANRNDIKIYKMSMPINTTFRNDIDTIILDLCPTETNDYPQLYIPYDRYVKNHISNKKELYFDINDLQKSINTCKSKVRGN